MQESVRQGPDRVFRGRPVWCQTICWGRVAGTFLELLCEAAEAEDGRLTEGVRLGGGGIPASGPHSPPEVSPLPPGGLLW